MTIESQQLHSIPPSDAGAWTAEEVGGAHNREMEEGKVVMEGKENMVKGESSLIKYGKPVLTPAQLMEFQQQGLIFKHMKAGLPVPLHLVIPIWKSVANSFGSDIAGFYKRFPSFVGFSPQEFDYRTLMDPEPGRCRRTDGKKWRCSKNVVPDQKYCERHMHRGRQRSRKLVEASEIVSPSVTASNSENMQTVLTHSQNDPRPQSPSPLSIIPPSNSKISTAVSALFRLTAASSSNIDNVISSSARTKDDKKNNFLFSGISDSKNVVKGSLDSTTTIAVAADKIANSTISIPRNSVVTTSSPTIMTITTIDEDNNVSSSKKSATTIPISVDTTAATTPIPASDLSTGTSAANKTINCNNNKKNCNVGRKCNGCNCSATKSIMNISNKGGNNHSSYASAGLGFSPKSVLQVVGCSGSCFYRSDMELEPGRCRRTDGKKWRCSRDVVPDQKYCGRHMHRGAKKRVETSHSVITATSSVCLPRTITISNEADSATLNTNLSISIPASPQLLNNDEKCPASSSDATISDTTITAYENSSFCS